MKKQSKETVKNRLDKAWSLKIRSKGYCEVCGKTADQCQLHPHHIWGRKNLSTRWDIRNGCCLCATHHTLGNQSAHNHPFWFIDWIKETRGEDYTYIQAKMKEPPRPYSLQDYLNIEKTL